MKRRQRASAAESARRIETVPAAASPEAIGDLRGKVVWIFKTVREAAGAGREPFAGFQTGYDPAAYKAHVTWRPDDGSNCAVRFTFFYDDRSVWHILHQSYAPAAGQDGADFAVIRVSDDFPLSAELPVRHATDICYVPVGEGGASGLDFDVIDRQAVPFAELASPISQRECERYGDGLQKQLIDLQQRRG